mmetsp:Transcript_18898/g.63763  ORF Transcript_18898/g.63763 Transcript_18898/m.63763 type:complete len:247 (-) Transcript_18898:22-762(-)
MPPRQQRHGKQGRAPPAAGAAATLALQELGDHVGAAAPHAGAGAPSHLGGPLCEPRVLGRDPRAAREQQLDLRHECIAGLKSIAYEGCDDRDGILSIAGSEYEDPYSASRQQANHWRISARARNLERGCVPLPDHLLQGERGAFAARGEPGVCQAARLEAGLDVGAGVKEHLERANVALERRNGSEAGRAGRFRVLCERLLEAGNLAAPCALDGSLSDEEIIGARLLGMAGRSHISRGRIAIPCTE